MTFLTLLLWLAITPPRLFDILPAKAMSAGPGETERVAISFAPVETIAELRSGDIVQMPVGFELADYEILRVTSFIPGTLSLTAKAADGSGSHIALTFQDGRVIGKSQDFRQGRLDLYAMDEASGGAYRAKTTYSELPILGCGTAGDHADHAHSDGPSRMSQIALPDTETLRSAAMDIQSSGIDSVTIDLLILYTTSAREWAEQNFQLQSIETAVAQAMNLSQQALDLSNQAIKLRLVRVRETTYVEEGTPSDVTLRRLSARAGDTANWGIPSGSYGLIDEAHTLRDQHGADLVALLANVTDTGGIAWVLNSHSGSPTIGFSVNNIRQTHFTYTLIHEIGHNMGNLHGRTQSSQPASKLGGLNPYSVGYRWNATNGNGYVTVMHYESSGFARTPYFSSATAQVDGVSIGSAGQDSTSADNQRSMRNIRRVLAANRATVTGTPTLAVTDNLVVDIPKNATREVMLDFTHSGTTDAMWRAQRVYRPAASGKETASAPVVLYDNGFEAEDGFPVGNFGIRNGLRATNTAVTYGVRAANPKSGSQHARFAFVNGVSAGTNMFFDSPQFEGGSIGHYRFTFDINMAAGAPTRFDLYLRDNTSSDLAGGFIIIPDTVGGQEKGRIYTYRRAGPDNALSFWSNTDWGTNGSLDFGRYNTLTFEIDPVTGTIRYQVDDKQPIEAASVGGNRISSFTIVMANPSSMDTRVDIDNIRLTQDFAYLPGFTLTQGEGTVRPGTTFRLPVTIDTDGLSVGQTYVGFIDFATNDGLKTSRIQINVGEPVSVDRDEVSPNATRLLAAYPNPFNPSTVIGFQLSVLGEARLAVYDILGREVAVLVDGMMPAGSHSATFDGRTLSSGVYIVRLVTAAGVQSKTVTLLK
jgi:hypothetical protein